ncbi:hypothetical protein BST36_09225 [Mycolicibacterium moriokaense]|nr:hypothetical protein BST36_09225 [Mycolicibacterium moriokaense]
MHLIFMAVLVLIVVGVVVAVVLSVRALAKPKSSTPDAYSAMAPGWYPDPSNPSAQLRYFDGSAWTGSTHPPG